MAANAIIIAAAQSSAKPGDIAANLATHLRFAEAAAAHSVQLLVFPELSLTGYELSLAPSHTIDPRSPQLHPLRHQAVRTRVTIVAGAPLAAPNNQLHIGAIAFLPDGSLSTYAKIHVHSSEQHVFSPGPGGPDLHIDGTPVALAICADASHPQHAANAAARRARIYATGAMIDIPAYPRKSALLESYARDHGMAVLLANYSGDTGGMQSAGNSAIWSETGTPIAVAQGREELLVIASRQSGHWTGSVVSL
ncbi:MAG: carbon-nitrogen hydrolase family protein [Acidobacteria bacterium]|nr:carbon-nitrogen hydrolase family protein [Acidobacteriota bacterium]